MAKESDFQTKVLRWLRSQGAWCMKVPASPGVPKGTSDIFGCKNSFYFFLECKASKNAKFQAGQKDFLAKMDDWSYAKAVWPGERWEAVQEELGEMLRGD